MNDVTRRTNDGYARGTTQTGPNGITSRREVTVNCDKAAGSCSQDVQITHSDRD